MTKPELSAEAEKQTDYLYRACLRCDRAEECYERVLQLSLQKAFLLGVAAAKNNT